jgi:hypothetical protein
MNGVKTILRNKELQIDSCHGEYLWIGNTGTHDPLIVDTPRKLKKLRAACDALLKKMPKENMPKRTNYG